MDGQPEPITILFLLPIPRPQSCPSPVPNPALPQLDQAPCSFDKRFLNLDDARGRALVCRVSGHGPCPPGSHTGRGGREQVFRAGWIIYRCPAKDAKETHRVGWPERRVRPRWGGWELWGGSGGGEQGRGQRRELRARGTPSRHHRQTAWERPPPPRGPGSGRPPACTAHVRAQSDTTPLGHQVWGPTRLGSLIHAGRGEPPGARLPGEVGGWTSSCSHRGKSCRARVQAQLHRASQRARGGPAPARWWLGPWLPPWAWPRSGGWWQLADLHQQEQPSSWASLSLPGPCTS